VDHESGFRMELEGSGFLGHLEQAPVVVEL
jgi:hypothetical protein